MEHLQPLQQNTSKLARQSLIQEDPGSLHQNYQGTSSIMAPAIMPTTPKDQQDSGRLSNGGGPLTHNMGANIGLAREYIDPEKKILRVLCQRYELKEELGKGAHGRIFSGKDKISRQPIAIKIMEKISKNKSKFVREISLMKDMNKFCQLGFPRLYYHSSDKNYYYIVMEQLQSSLKDLRDHQEDKKFSIKTVTMIALQMLQRLESIHKYGYVHRDLKPANIMVGKNFKTQELSVVYLIDFGLTKKQNQVSNLPNQDMGNKVVGTAVYAGINAHLPSANYFKKDDIESLMYVLCYLGTGTLPWKNYKSTDIGLEKMMKYKIKISPFDLFQDMPNEYAQILDYIKNLTSDTAIDYLFIESLLRQVAQNLKFKLDNRFDWISTQQTSSMPMTPVTPSRLLQQHATAGFNNTLNEQTSKQLIGHPSGILNCGNTQNIRNSTIRKPPSIASPYNEESQTPGNRPGIIIGQAVSLGQSNAMPNSNPDIYSGFMVASAGMGLGKPQTNMIDSHMDNSHPNFQSQMANTQNHEPASGTMTIHLDFKSKQEFADVHTNQNKFQDLKNMSNKFTLRPETTQLGGVQQQSVNFIDNDTNMIQSKGLLLRCEASELNNNDSGGAFAQSQRKPNHQKSSMMQSNFHQQKQSHTNLAMNIAVQENLLQVPVDVSASQQNQIEKQTKHNKTAGIKNSKSPQNGSRKGQPNEGEEKPSAKKKMGAKTKKKAYIGDPKNKSQIALTSSPNEQINNNNTSQTQVITILKERQPQLLSNKKDSKINLTDNNDINQQKKEVSVAKLEIVPEEGGTQKKSSGGSSIVNKKLGLAAAASGATSNMPNDQQVSFAINKQQQIQGQQVVLINMSNQSNNANNQVVSNVDSSGRVPNFAAALMNNGGVSETQNKKQQTRRAGGAADIDIEKIAENMHIMISDVQQSRQEMSKQVIESLTFEEFEQGILSERIYKIQSKPDISLNQLTDNNKSNQEQKILNTQIGFISPREFYTHSNLEKMRNQTSKSLILTSQTLKKHNISTKIIQITMKEIRRKEMKILNRIDYKRDILNSIN